MKDRATTRRRIRARPRGRPRPESRRRRLAEAAALLVERPAALAEIVSEDGRGPYEDCYDVCRGYAVERVIVRP